MRTSAFFTFYYPRNRSTKCVNSPKVSKCQEKETQHTKKKTFLLSRGAKWDEQVKTHPQIPRPPRFPPPHISLPCFRSPHTTSPQNPNPFHPEGFRSATGGTDRSPKPSAPPEKGAPSGRATSSPGNGDGVGARQARSRHQALHALPGEARGRRGCAAWAGRR